MDPLVIHLQDRRQVFAERLDLFGHATAAFGLVTAALGALPARTAGAAVLAGVELAGAAALALALRHEWRGRTADRPARISRLNLLAAALLLVQWHVERRAGGKLFSPELLSAIVAGALAFLHPVIQRRRRERRALRIDDDGITLATGRFRRFRASWSDLRSVDAEPDALRFGMADGRGHRVDLRAITNRAEAIDAVAAAAGRRGIGRSGGEHSPGLSG